MAAKLKVRKDQIGNTVHFNYNGHCHSVYLDDATPQEQLQMVQFVGVDVFEKPEKGEKEK